MTEQQGQGNDDSLDFDRLGAASPGGIPSPSLSHVRFVADRSGAPIVTPKPAPAWLGKRVGQYRLLSLLGQGAMGKVFRAEDTVLHRHVALKVMPTSLTRGGKTYSLEQFVNEARAAAAIEHPNVVRIYEVSSSKGIYYIAMELVDGGNLHDLVKGNGRLDAARACTLLAEAAEALHAGHQLGVIHRDVKPANLLLARQGCCKVGDFGLAKLMDIESAQRRSDSVGTPQFVAPEVIRGMPASAASDVYSLGCTAWYLLAARPPYIGMTKRETLTMHLEQPVPDLAELRPDLPESLTTAIARALAKQSSERFSSAERFAKVLRVHTIPVASAPRLPAAPVMIELPPPAAAAPHARFGKSAKMWAGIGVIGIILLAAAMAWNAGTRPPLPKPSVATASPELAEDDAAVEAARSGGSTHPAAATVPAENVDHLIDIAANRDPELGGKTIAVEGRATWADLSPSGKTFRVGFASSGAGRGFCLAYSGRLFDAMRDRFGGRHGEGLKGQHLRITGQLSLHKGQPEIKIDSPSQIEVIQD